MGARGPGKVRDLEEYLAYQDSSLSNSLENLPVFQKRASKFTTSIINHIVFKSTGLI